VKTGTDRSACATFFQGLRRAAFGVSTRGSFFILLKPELKDYARYFLRRGVHAVGWIILWAFWLALGVLLYVQARIATSDEIVVPAWVLRSVEQRFAEQGLRLTFGSVRCDTAGNVVLRDVALFSGGFDDPIVTVRAARCTVNPYGLLVRRIVPHSLRIDDGSFRLPAMFSNDGANSAVIDNITADVELQGNTLFVNGLSARIENLVLLCHGGVWLPRSGRGEKTDSQMLAEAISMYLKIARQVAAFAPRLNMLGEPVLDVALAPDEQRMARARVMFAANSLRVNADERTGGSADGTADGMPAVTSGPLRADTSFELAMFASPKVAGSSPASRRGEQDAPPTLPLHVNAISESVQVAQTASARDVRLALTVPFSEVQQLFQRDAPAQASAPPSAPSVNGQLRVMAGSATMTKHNVTARSLSAAVSGQFPKNLRATIAGELFATPLSLEAGANLDDQSATLAVSTRVTPRHIAAIASKTDVALDTILKPAHPIALDAVARLDAGWRPVSVRGHVETGAILAHGVPVDRAHGTFTLDPAARAITFSPAMAAVGESVARGSFTTNFDTRDFRFLLKGNLRPPAITRWIGPWWGDFWRDFDFRGAAPHGDVDVQGNWGDESRSRVFIFVDAARPAYNKVMFDRARLTLFSKPDLNDIIALRVTRGGGHATGSFSIATRGKATTTTLNFTANNIDPVAVAPAISPDVVDVLKPFKFAAPLPDIKVAGHVVDAPAASGGNRVTLDIEAAGDGAFSYEKIPFTGLATGITIRDDKVVIKNLATQIAGGQLNANARLHGIDKQRRIAFDLTLNDANLGGIAAIVKASATRGRADTGDGDVADKKDEGDNTLEKQLAGGLLDLRMNAEGLVSDFLSFTGTGNVEVTGGANLLSINIFGSLSQAISSERRLGLTTINLNTGQASFSIDGARLKVPDAVLKGSRAVIKLRGDYWMDTRYTNIMARVYPLSATRNIIGRGIGVLLVPVSHLTELRFSGPIDSPRWRFSYGPTSLFRALSGQSSRGGGGAPTAPAEPTLEPEPEPEPSPAPAPAPVPVLPFGQPRPLPFGGAK